eukprot:840398-Pleurochrysis_carterae.AAC.1
MVEVRLLQRAGSAAHEQLWQRCVATRRVKIGRHNGRCGHAQLVPGEQPPVLSRMDLQFVCCMRAGCVCTRACVLVAPWRETGG